mgnify:CR=1 FL=1
MRSLVVDTLEGLLYLATLVVILVGGAVGVGASSDLRAIAALNRWSIADDWNWQVVGGLLGALGGLIAASLVFGVLFVLLDIRAQLVELNARGRTSG